MAEMLKTSTARPPLSTSPSARAWIHQFDAVDQVAAAGLADALILLNEADVAAAIRDQLARLAKTRKGPRRKVALFPEREFAESEIFKSALTPPRPGRARRRAFGETGPPAVTPLRGRIRVGVEGPGAFLLSRAGAIARGA